MTTQTPFSADAALDALMAAENDLPLALRIEIARCMELSNAGVIRLRQIEAGLEFLRELHAAVDGDDRKKSISREELFPRFYAALSRFRSDTDTADALELVEIVGSLILQARSAPETLRIKSGET